MYESNVGQVDLMGQSSGGHWNTQAPSVLTYANQNSCSERVTMEENLRVRGIYG